MHPAITWFLFISLLRKDFLSAIAMEGYLLLGWVSVLRVISAVDRPVFDRPDEPKLEPSLYLTQSKQSPYGQNMEAEPMRSRKEKLIQMVLLANIFNRAK